LANRWTDEPQTGEQPKADLNPLLNPVLEENLGRWAQVYFTNPPETRERAVMDLLRELENREHPNTTTALNPPPAAVNSTPATPTVEKAPCPVCKGENRLDQKFCGFCGSTLQAQPNDNLAAAATPLHAAAGSPGEPLSFLGLSSAATDAELDSLRDRSFDMSYYEPDSGRHRGLYITAALIILIGGITYLTWPALLMRLPPVWQEAILRQQPARVTASAPGTGSTAAPIPPSMPTAAAPPSETEAAAPGKTIVVKADFS
jgi:hypothetical protein